MFVIKKIIEIVNSPIVKIRGLTSNNEYFEIRLKDNWLDVRVSKSEYESMRCIYRDKVYENLTVHDVFEVLKISMM